jgi:hypothetical protein
MHTYKEQLEMLSNVRLKAGDHRRVDCPFCAGRKTLSVSNVDGKLLWHCYKASCPARGAKSLGRNTEQIRGRLSRQDAATTRRTPPLPDPVSDPSQHDHVLRYLEDNGSLEAYEQGDVRIAYAPAEDRVLFYMPSRLGAVGRALSGGGPKWRAYGDTSGLLTVGSGSTTVVVEDAASACAVSRVEGLQGAALMGTNLSTQQKRQLRHSPCVVIALDKDASRKSLLMAQTLQGLVPCRVRLLETDLKYVEPDEIERIIK